MRLFEECRFVFIPDDCSMPAELVLVRGGRESVRRASAGRCPSAGASLATFIGSVAWETFTGPPSARIDRSPRITCSLPSIGVHDLGAAGRGRDCRLVTSIHSPSLTPVRTSAR